MAFRKYYIKFVYQKFLGSKDCFYCTLFVTTLIMAKCCNRKNPLRVSLLVKIDIYFIDICDAMATISVDKVCCLFLPFKTLSCARPAYHHVDHIKCQKPFYD